jgi:CSLREA domain-containing protein
VTMVSNSRIASRLALLSALAWSASGLSAEVTFVVNTTADLIDNNIGDGLCRTDSNSCSLRAAIMQANRLSEPGPKVINLPPGVFVLSRVPNGLNGDDNGDLNLDPPPPARVNPGEPESSAAANGIDSLIEVAYIVIRGAGAGSTIIDANHIDGVLRIEPGRQARIESLSIRHGSRVGEGGGILNQGGLTLVQCVVEENFAVVDAGGIYSSGWISVEGSTIRSNVAGRNGGGMSVNGSSVMRDSTVHGNHAGSHGGGVHNTDRLDVVNSTIGNNSANTDGGGFYSSNATYLRNTTVVNNDADHDRDQNGGIGGGIYAVPGSLFGVVNSLIAGNTLLDAPIYNDCSGLLNASGRNLFFLLNDTGTGCNFIGAGIGLVSLNTLGPLQDNGGPTWTHALLAGSEAINATIAGDGCTDQGGGNLTMDQRGAPRIAGPRCDVGAFEFGANVSPIFKSSFE